MWCPHNHWVIEYVRTASIMYYNSVQSVYFTVPHKLLFSLITFPKFSVAFIFFDPPLDLYNTIIRVLFLSPVSLCAGFF